MSDVMLDTTVWIQFLRKNGDQTVAEQVDGLLASDRAVLCGMVELEILQGTRPQERPRLQELLRAISYAETQREDFIDAGERLGILRKRGITVPPSDGLIAAICIRHKMKLFSTDQHFDHFRDLGRFP